MLESISELMQNLRTEAIWSLMQKFSFEIALCASIAVLLLMTWGVYRAFPIKFWYSLFISVAISIIIILYPLKQAGFGDFGDSFWKKLLQVIQIILQSGYDAAGVITIKLGYLTETIKAIRSCVGGLLGDIYVLYICILFLGAAVVFIGSSISILKDISPNRKLRETGRRHVYAFSELNEKSLALAKDYKKQKENKKAFFVFTGVKNETNTELLHKAHKMHAIVIKSDITVIRFKNMLSVQIVNLFRNLLKKVFPFSGRIPQDEISEEKPKSPKKKKTSKNKSPKKQIKFFLIGENEDRNLIQALTLINKYNDKENIEIFVFSKKIESGLVLSSVDAGQIKKVRKVNEVRSLVNRILIDDGLRLFETAKEDQNDKSKPKTISAMIVGLGHHGTEMVKALSWYGQMDGYSIEINAFDKNKSAGQKFSAAAPTLTSKVDRDKTLLMNKKCAVYKIDIHSEVDVNEINFKTIEEFSNVTYVFVALGNDEDNIRTAVSLRTYFARMGSYPIIQAVVYNSALKRALQGSSSEKSEKANLPICNLKTHEGTCYDIEFVGDIETTYTKAVIEPEEIEREALNFHKRYDPEKLFWQYEYCYNSSMGAAIHGRAVEACGISGEAATTLEHRRWIAYMAGEGYVPGEKNSIAKTHDALEVYDDLDDKYRKKIVTYEEK